MREMTPVGSGTVRDESQVLKKWMPEQCPNCQVQGVTGRWVKEMAMSPNCSRIGNLS